MIFRLTITILVATHTLCAYGANKPNIVLFVTDDQSPTAGCYGSPVIQTPNLDRLAAAGTRFTRVYATTASCSASRSAMLTGIQNHANGQYGHSHQRNKFETFRSCAALSLPNQLKALGYRTAHIGKLHVAPESVYHFDTIHLNNRNRNNTPSWSDQWKPLIHEKSDRPFFLNFWTYDPHRSKVDDQTAPEKLKPNRFGNPEAGKNYPDGFEEVVYRPEDVVVPAYLPDTIECRRELAQYYQSCTRADKTLGLVIDELKKAGQYENTMIIYTADHGMAFAGAKTNVYQASLHVPFVVKMPGRKAGVINDAMLSLIDVTPSILDAAGGLDRRKNAPKKLLPIRRTNLVDNLGPGFTRYHGRSWLDLVGTDQGKGWDQVFASHTFHEVQMYYPMRAVIDRKHMLVWNIASPLAFPLASDLRVSSTWVAQAEKGMDAKYGFRTIHSYLNRPQFELYDLVKDPHGSKNVASDPHYTEVIRRMKQRIKDFQKDTADPWFSKWQYE